MAFSRLVIEHPLTAEQLQSKLGLERQDKISSALELGKYMRSLAAGLQSADLDLHVGAVQATGLVSFSGLPSNDEILTIANVVFTAKSSGATGNQFNIGGSATITAANLAAAINASANLSGIVTASSAAGVVTLTAVVPGKAGNGLQLSEGLSNATVTAFASGADGTAYSFDLL